jgi:hypothetical protein
MTISSINGKSAQLRVNASSLRVSLDEVESLLPTSTSVSRADAMTKLQSKRKWRKWMSFCIVMTGFIAFFSSMGARKQPQDRPVVWKTIKMPFSWQKYQDDDDLITSKSDSVPAAIMDLPRFPNARNKSETMGNNDWIKHRDAKHDYYIEDVLSE